MGELLFAPTAGLKIKILHSIKDTSYESRNGSEFMYKMTSLDYPFSHESANSNCVLADLYELGK